MPLRFVRSSAVTAAVLGLAAAAHIAAGGRLPPLPLMVLLAALVMVPITALSRYRLSIPLLAAILAVGQSGLHFAFIALSGSSDQCARVAPPAHGDHAPASTLGCVATEASPLVEAAATASPGTPVMTAAHILATAFTVLALARAEAAFWQVCAWLRPLVAAPQPVRQRPSVRLTVTGRTFRPIPAPGTRITAPRGPPQGAVAPAS